MDLPPLLFCPSVQFEENDFHYKMRSASRTGAGRFTLRVKKANKTKIALLLTPFIFVVIAIGLVVYFSTRTSPPPSPPFYPQSNGSVLIHSPEDWTVPSDAFVRCDDDKITDFIRQNGWQRHDPAVTMLYFASSDIDAAVMQEHIEIVDRFAERAGRYANFIHVVYTTADQSQHLFDLLNYLNFGDYDGTIDSIEAIQSVQGCLSGVSQYSLCIQPYYKHYGWDQVDLEAGGNLSAYGHASLYHGWLHEYFHHIQKSRTLHSMYVEANNVYWWKEGFATSLPSLYMQEHWHEFQQLETINFTDSVAWSSIDLAIIDRQQQCDDASAGNYPADSFGAPANCSINALSLYACYYDSARTCVSAVVDTMNLVESLGFDQAFEQSVGFGLEELYAAWNANYTLLRSPLAADAEFYETVNLTSLFALLKKDYVTES